MPITRRYSRGYLAPITSSSRYIASGPSTTSATPATGGHRRVDARRGGSTGWSSIRSSLRSRLTLPLPLGVVTTSESPSRPTQTVVGTGYAGLAEGGEGDELLVAEGGQVRGEGHFLT